jgi:hypothetical protein
MFGFRGTTGEAFIWVLEISMMIAPKLGICGPRRFFLVDKVEVKVVDSVMILQSDLLMHDLQHCPSSYSIDRIQRKWLLMTWVKCDKVSSVAEACVETLPGKCVS